jgi:hypothetical protein
MRVATERRVTGQCGSASQRFARRGLVLAVLAFGARTVVGLAAVVAAFEVCRGLRVRLFATVVLR